jgi:hypothetical protein
MPVVCPRKGETSQVPGQTQELLSAYLFVGLGVNIFLISSKDKKDNKSVCCDVGVGVLRRGKPDEIPYPSAIPLLEFLLARKPLWNRASLSVVAIGEDEAQ